VAFGFATAARDVVYPLIIIESFGVRYLASIYGALMFAMAPAGSLGPIFAAAIHDSLGSYRWAFAVFVATNLLALAALGFVRNERIAR
jgi:cyanate permease